MPNWLQLNTSQGMQVSNLTLTNAGNIISDPTNLNRLLAFVVWQTQIEEESYEATNGETVWCDDNDWITKPCTITSIG